MKFQFRLLTLLAFVVSLGLMIGLNVRTKWNSVLFGNNVNGAVNPNGEPGSLVGYGWPIPVYFTREYKQMRIGPFFRAVGPGLELDMLLVNCIVAALFIAGTCYLARRIFRKEPP